MKTIVIHETIKLQQTIDIPAGYISDTGPIWETGFKGAVVEFASSPIGYGNRRNVQIVIARCANNWVTLVWNNRGACSEVVFEANQYCGPSYSRAVSMMELLCQEYVGAQIRWLREEEQEFFSSAYANA